MKQARLVDLLTENQAIAAAKKGINISDEIDMLSLREVGVLSRIVLRSSDCQEGDNLICLTIQYLIDKAEKKDLEIFI